MGATYELTPDSPAVPNWKGLGLDTFNPRLWDGLPSERAREPGCPSLPPPFLKASWNPADNISWPEFTGGRARVAAPVAGGDHKAREIQSAVQARKIRRKDVNLGYEWKPARDRLGTERGPRGRLFGLLIWNSPGEVARPEMGRESRIGRDGTLS
jgi:hypothetical protein